MTGGGASGDRNYCSANAAVNLSPKIAKSSAFLFAISALTEAGSFTTVIPGAKAQPAPVVPEEAYSDDCPELYPSQPDAWAAGWNACRAVMLQAGNSPAIPDGYVMVPKELTCEMDDAAWEAYHNTRCMSDIWDALLSLAPQLPGSEPATVPGKWIPVSEKLPERGDWLVTDGCDFDVQLFNGEQFIPGFVWEDKITHWMPLPTAPQEEAK